MNIKYLFIFGLFLNPFIAAGKSTAPDTPINQKSNIDTVISETLLLENPPVSTNVLCTDPYSCGFTLIPSKENQEENQNETIILEDIFAEESPHEPNPVEFNLSPQEVDRLWEEMAFKTSVVSAINTLMTVNSAIGFDVENPTPGRNKIAIPLAAGYLIFAEAIRRGLLSLSHSSYLNFEEYNKNYKNLVSEINETKKKIKAVKKESSARGPAKFYAETAEITPAEAPPEDDTSAKQSRAEKKAEKIQTSRDTLAKIKYEKRAELKALRETLDQLQFNLKELNEVKPKFYRTRKILKIHSYGAVILGSIAIYPLIVGDMLLLTFKVDEDLYALKRDFERDINAISKALRLNIDSSDLSK